MSVTLRPYRGGGWEVDITIRLPDGSQYRERKRASRFSKSAAHRWAEDRERYLLQHGPPRAKKEVPTLETFAPRFVDGHARANRQKARRPCGPLDDAALHGPESSGNGRRDPVARRAEIPAS
jgi:hypothetical protein